ncbi:trypsin-like peptidase domain-containing protein [Streptomyces broussonetiae]|uniref:Serine protease n=1 Tax=Streptomyces broussonetiae TaxID=2686304 RepID=A0A6I6N700_9ACTN|nr:trypsin-like peptidase domain-containing protein [Streptomyces broussonetiae]QHA07172.1 serine protease [Streptomyces broussonetiae]
MAGRGPRTGSGRRQTADAVHRGQGDRTDAASGQGACRADGAPRTVGTTRAAAPAQPYDTPHRPPLPALVEIRDLAGRPRGIGFLADHLGTLLTSHETVDGLPRLVLHAADDRAGERVCVVDAGAVVPLPARDLALVRTEGLGLAPLPLTVRERVDAGTYVRIPAGCWREARVLAAIEATYTATDRFHLLEDALELAIGTAGRDALRLGGGAAGGPVLDAGTGAVLGVLGTALHSARRDAGFAVPLRPADGPLAELLARNAATVPAYGADLNLAGILELTATSVGQDGSHGRRCAATEPVERAHPARELAAFEHGDRAVLALVGAPGSGRTTQLTALAARRARAERPAPTLWLRGADLEEADGSVADAARRTLDRAARIVAAARSAHPDDLGDVTPEWLARQAARAGRPLLLLLDGPEEMPPLLAHRTSEWTRGTADWLRATGARLVVACREEYWERAGAEFPADLLHATPARSTAQAAPAAPTAPLALTTPTAPGAFTPHLPPCVRLGALSPDEARRARARFGIPDGALVERDARHPLTLRLLSEVRAATPDAPAARPVDRHEVFAAYLDLMCLRVAVRLAVQSGLRGTAVRRLAARVAGQVHEAARRSLGPGQGELDRESFETVFPWGLAPARLGGGTGWASAVLAEGLLVPAGDGYRFAHEELADWIQGMHLDLDEALHALVHRPHAPREPAPDPVPHHRVGPVVQALLFLARQRGSRQLTARLRDLTDTLERDPGSWWAARLLARTLLQVPDATPYTEVLRLLADRIVALRRARREVPADFGPAFWTELPLPDAERLALLRGLVLADQAPPEPGERYLDAVARLLAAAPAAVQPQLTHWFDDERPLPATPHATVATAAQALLHTHRHGALDGLTDILVASAHRRAHELLTTLAEDEPSALCRAVERWAHDERPARRAAAVTFGLHAAPQARAQADRELLRRAALALLARPADDTLHGGALALLIHDPHTRGPHLPAALRAFAEGDPHLTPRALAPALATHPEAVLAALRPRLHGADAALTLRVLADATTPALAHDVAALAREAVRQHPETAGQLAAHVDHRLEQGPTARPVLLPLVIGLLHDSPEPLRAALAAVLSAAGSPASRPLRRELLEVLFTGEQAPSVLAAVLHAAAEHGDRREEEARGLVRRTGLLLVRTPEGATRFDRCLVELGRHVPGFAVLMARWLADTPDDWAAVVGPSTRRTLENLAGVRVPA